jgi:hypothetical protein
MEIPLFCQIVCIGTGGLVKLVFVLRWLVLWQRRTNDPLRYLPGKVTRGNRSDSTHASL